jgi:transposase InsO family protein
MLHDRDSVWVLRTPVRAPTANAFRARRGSSLRRECLDYLILLYDRHLRMIVRKWGLHYKRGRPHSSLGPGIPEPRQEAVPECDHRHKRPAGYRVEKTPAPGGLHQEYRLVQKTA